MENATATHFAATGVLPYLTPRPPLKKARIEPPDVPGILSYGPAFTPRASGSISPFSASMRNGAADADAASAATTTNEIAFFSFFIFMLPFLFIIGR